MKPTYHLIFKNGSISNVYEDFRQAQEDAIEYSEQNEEGCALYSSLSGLSLFFCNGKQVTTWVSYELVQYWFSDDEEKETKEELSISIIDHILPENNHTIGDDEIDNFLDIYIDSEQVKTAYQVAGILHTYVISIELFDVDIRINFADGTYIGFTF